MNKKITAIIVDDNKGAITDLQNMLQTHCPNIEVLATYEYSSDALKDVNLGKIKPELLFLDIQMDNDRIDGLELFELILKANATVCNAVFVTVHNKYTKRAFDLNCLDYIVKPIKKEALVNAVEKQKENNSKYINERITNAKDLKENREITSETTMSIKNGYEIIKVMLFDICYCKSAGNYSEIYVKNNKRIISNHSLKKLTEMLPEDYFYRCHNEYIIDKLYVHKFKNTVRDCSVTLKVNNEYKKLPVSRSRKNDLFDFLNNY